MEKSYSITGTFDVVTAKISKDGRIYLSKYKELPCTVIIELPDDYEGGD